MRELGYYLTHPLALGAAAFGVLEGVLTVFASAPDLWFPIVGALWRLGGLVPWLPGQLLTEIAVVGFVAYIVLKSDTLWDRLKTTLTRDK